MSFLRRLSHKTIPTAQEYTTLNFGEGFFPLPRTGIAVSQMRGLQQATVWACVRLRAETIGALPVDVVSYDGDTRIRQDLPPWLQRPNPETTRFELFERTSASLDTDGNAFWYFTKDRLGRVAEVWVLPPRSVKVWRNEDQPGSPKLFTIDGEDYTADSVLHISAFSLPGRLRGLSPIDQHRNAIGLAVAAEEFGESFFGNGAQMSGIIESERDPGPEAVNRMRASFARDHQGLRNAHKPGFLFGAKWTQLTIPNEQSQFLETRKYQTTEIARVFRVPPHKIGDLDRATFSNIEHQAIEWVTDGVVPYTARIEAAVEAGGLLDQDQHLKFNFAGLLRGDTQSRYAAYAVARQWGWLSVDEIRALEDMNPLPDGAGDVHLQPMNMTEAGAPPAMSEQAGAPAEVPPARTS